MLYLAVQGKPVTGPTVAEAMSISPIYLMTIFGKLKSAGLVSVLRGNRGGYFLAKQPENISLLDIVEVMEGTTRINRCLEDDKYCNRFATENCPVRRVYAAIQSNLENSLRSVTLQALQEKAEG